MNQRGFASIIFILVVAGLILGGILLWRSSVFRESSTFVPGALSTISPILTNQPSSTLDTTGWKTYRNEKYGFEFLYPINLDLLITEPTDAPVYPSDKLGVSIINENEVEFKNNQTRGFRTFTVSGYPALERLQTGTVCIFSKILTYCFYDDTNQNQEIFDKILSTFKFIEPK